MKQRSKVQVIKATSEEMPALGNIIPKGAREGTVFLFHERQADGRIGSCALVFMVRPERKRTKAPGGTVVPIIEAPPEAVPMLSHDPVTQALGSLIVDLLERVSALETDRDERASISSAPSN